MNRDRALLLPGEQGPEMKGHLTSSGVCFAGPRKEIQQPRNTESTSPGEKGARAQEGESREDGRSPGAASSPPPLSLRAAGAGQAGSGACSGETAGGFTGLRGRPAAPGGKVGSSPVRGACAGLGAVAAKGSGPRTGPEDTARPSPGFSPGLMDVTRRNSTDSTVWSLGRPVPHARGTRSFRRLYRLGV